MGLKYLNGCSWAEITREERYFCQHLYSLILKHGISSFVSYLNSRHKTTLSPEMNWELAFEACFYRDIWAFRGGNGVLFSPKRTFDLCLLSDSAIVVIEAKADQAFDEEQLQCFERDKHQVAVETGVNQVLLAGLASSRYNPPHNVRAYFDGPFLTWNEVATLYGDDPILARADAIYIPGSGWDTGRNNAGGYQTGASLLVDHSRGEIYFVGRDGGLNGPKLAADLSSGNWRNQQYETNRTGTTPPNRNWFWLSEFAGRVAGSE